MSVPLTLDNLDELCPRIEPPTIPQNKDARYGPSEPWSAEDYKAQWYYEAGEVYRLRVIAGLLGLLPEATGLELLGKPLFDDLEAALRKAAGQ